LAQGEDDWDLEKFSEELRLASPPGGRLEWSSGAFYTHEIASETRYRCIRQRLPPDAAFAPYLDYFSLPATYSDRAVFADLYAGTYTDGTPT
jgi:hypothetical protein